MNSKKLNAWFTAALNVGALAFACWFTFNSEDIGLVRGMGVASGIFLIFASQATAEVIFQYPRAVALIKRLNEWGMKKK